MREDPHMVRPPKPWEAFGEDVQHSAGAMFLGVGLAGEGAEGHLQSGDT